MHAHCILPNCPESPIGNWKNIRHVPQRAAQPALVSMCVPQYYPSLFLPSFIASRAAGNIRCRQMPEIENIVVGAANFTFSSLRIQAVTANFSYSTPTRRSICAPEGRGRSWILSTYAAGLDENEDSLSRFNAC